MTTTDRRQGVNAGQAIKVPCRVATTAAITLSGEQTIDGVAVVTGDRVLVKNQASSVDNGIYVADSSAWDRALDFDGTLDVVTGTLVFVTSGSTNGGWWYVSTVDAQIVPGTDVIDFGRSSTSLAVVSAFAQTLLDDATAAAARATFGLDDIIANVFDSGATGDGATDDSAAITAAIAALPASGGTVSFPPGEYRLVSGITSTRDGLTLRGAGAEATKLVCEVDDALTLTGCDWLRIEGMTIEGDNTTVGQRGIVADTISRSVVRDVMFRKFKGSAIDISGVNTLTNIVENVQVAAGTSPDATARAIKVIGGNILLVIGCYLNGYDELVQSTCDSFTSLGTTYESMDVGIRSGNGYFVSAHDKFYALTGSYNYVISGNYDTTIFSPRNCTLAQIDHSSMTDKKYLHLVGIEAQGTPVNTIAEPGLRVLRGTVDTTGAGTIIEGLGYTKSVNATGDITITFSTAFGDVPSVSAIADRTVGATGIAVYLNATSTTTTCRLKRVDAAGNPEDGYINFTVLGPA